MRREFVKKTESKPKELFYYHRNTATLAVDLDIELASGSHITKSSGGIDIPHKDMQELFNMVSDEQPNLDFRVIMVTDSRSGTRPHVYCNSLLVRKIVYDFGSHEIKEFNIDGTSSIKPRNVA